MVSIAKKPATRILGRPPIKRAAPAPATKPRKQLDGSYLVDSKTATLVAYSVRNLEQGWACDCPAGAFHNACWHLTAVLAVAVLQQLKGFVKVGLTYLFVSNRSLKYVPAQAVQVSPL